MNFRRTFFLALVALTIGAVSCSTTRKQATKEPSYQGRQLSEWLRDFDNYNPTPEQHAMAAEAIRHIGSPAVPFLLERLSDAQLKQTKIEQKKWRDRQATALFAVARPANPRREALAALDALGSEGVDALPALGKLLQDDPPDTQALYIAARIGPAGVPLLTKSLTSENKLVRLQAGICLEMMSSHSEVLYPKIPVGPDAPSFERRICEFNLKTVQGAMKQYIATYPETEPLIDVNRTPPPSVTPR